MKEEINIGVQQFPPFEKHVMPVLAIGMAFEEGKPKEMFINVKFSQAGSKMVEELGDAEIGKLIVSVGKKMIAGEKI